MAEVAEVLRLAPSEVQAVSTFYSMYFDKPAGDHHVLICVNVSCALRGADEIVSHVERRLACPSGGTTADGKFTWESTVECLGACGGRRRCRWTTTSTRTSPSNASTASSNG